MSLGCRKPYRMEESTQEVRTDVCDVRTIGRQDPGELGEHEAQTCHHAESGSVLAIVNMANLRGTIIMEKTSLGQAREGFGTIALTVSRIVPWAGALNQTKRRK